MLSATETEAHGETGQAAMAAAKAAAEAAAKATVAYDGTLDGAVIYTKLFKKISP